MRNYLFFTAEIFIYIIHKTLRFLKFFTFTKSSEKIGIIVFKKLGDTVFVVPAIQLLIQKYKKENVVIFCYSKSMPILEESIDAEIVKVGYYDFWLRGRIANYSVRKKIAKYKFKKIYDLTCQVRSATAILGFNAELKGHNDKYCSGVYDQFVNPLHINSLIDRFVYIADPYNSLIPFDWDGSFPPKLETEKHILIHPFAGWQAKEWNFNKFIDLYLLLSKEYLVTIIFESDFVSRDIKLFLEKEKINFKETNNIRDLITEIKECSLLIGNDSGPIYVARLLGKPTFTIYGPTNPQFTMVESIYHSKINKEIICSPLNDEQYCFTFAGRKGCPSFECMHQLKVDEVYSSILSYFNKIDFGINKRNEVI